MGIIKRLFCKHNYKPMDGYINLGWEKCINCGQERYSENLSTITHFYLGKFIVKQYDKRQ